MMLFVTGTVMGSAIFYNEMDAGKLLVAFGSILCPTLAITTSYGLVSLLGFRTNSFMLVMPFLIMGIGSCVIHTLSIIVVGVDDAFLMIHSWQRLALHGHDVRQRLGLVLEEVGPVCVTFSRSTAL